MKRFIHLLTRFIDLFSLLIFSWIIILLCLFSKFAEYACKMDNSINNLSVLIIFALIIVSLILLTSKVKLPTITLKYDKIVNITTFLLFIFQIYVCLNIFFETGWDSGGYIIPASRALLAHEDVQVMNDTYFSFYPNNILLVNIYYVILKINEMFGIFVGEQQLMAIVIINCVINTATCRLIYSVVRNCLDKKYAFIAFVGSILLIGISPWNVICYSDSFALFIPILILYIYINDKISIYLKYFFILLLAYIGYSIKPQTVIILIAIAIFKIINIFIKTQKKLLIKNCLIFICCTCIIVLLNNGLQNLYSNEGFDTNSDKKFGMTHFFMMGMNPERLGIWSGEDVQISAECPTQDARKAKNLDVAKERLKNYGISGYIKLLCKKMLTNYNDGTFAWSLEGGFYAIMKNDINTKTSPFLKNLYYFGGTHYSVFSSLVHTIWILIILFIFLRTVFNIKNKNEQEDYTYQIMILSVIGLTLFGLLFEARARYLYTYVPIYIIIAVYGLKDINNWIKEKF